MKRILVRSGSLVALALAPLLCCGQSNEPQRQDVKAITSHIQMLRKSDDQGNADAQCALGGAYAYGKGVPTNAAEAVAWYRKAAAQSNGVAMVAIGEMYEKGSGVDKNLDEAVKWYKRAAAIREQTFADWHLLRLSKAGLIKEKYEGIPVEGGIFLARADETTPIAELVQGLSTNTEEIETGKGYWIGYNAQMLSVAARGEAAIPCLVDFIKKVSEPKVRHAGLLALHLIGIECNVAGRFGENFKNRKAREALWDLMKVEGLADEVAHLLKRDPWPADVHAIMEALATVKGDCPETLNALSRYTLTKRPIDILAGSGLGEGSTCVRFTLPTHYTDRDYVRIAIDGIKEALSGRVKVDEGLLDQIPAMGRYGIPAPHKWEGTLDKLLEEIKDLRPVFDYVFPGRNVYYYSEVQIDTSDQPSPFYYGNPSRAILCFCTAATAKQRWLDWWQKSGREWYCFKP